MREQQRQKEEESHHPLWSYDSLPRAVQGGPCPTNFTGEDSSPQPHCHLSDLGTTQSRAFCFGPLLGSLGNYWPTIIFVVPFMKDKSHQ